MSNARVKKAGRKRQGGKDGLVLTPGGWRPRSMAHVIEPGYHVVEQGGRLQKVHTELGAVVEDLGAVPDAAPAAPKKPRRGGTARGTRKQTSKK